jgi:zinc transport system substrate-binding protein
MNRPPTRILANLVFVVAASLVLAGCKPKATTDSRPLVIASFYPLYDFARQLCGTNIQVVCLVPPGADPHGVEATPTMVKQVARADAVVLLGLGMDVWLDRIAENASKARRIVVTEGMATRPMGAATLAEFAADHAHDHHSHAHDHHGAEDIDPHVWLDPVRAGQIVERLADELQAVYPAHAAVIAANAERLKSELQQLDADFAAATVGLTRRDIVTFHGAFGYLFDPYGLKTVGVVELYPGDQPSAAYLRALVDLMNSTGLKTIFAEPQLPDAPARIIAREIGGKIERLDPCETLLPDAPEATYVERQRKNLETLRRVLGGQP